MKDRKQRLVLNKGAEKFIFIYETGEEKELLDALTRQVEDSRTNFDWIDAAVLTFRVKESLIKQADEFLSSPRKAQVK